MAFSDFCAKLGSPLRNVRQSWSGISHERHRAVFTIWADQLVDGRYVFLPKEHEFWMDKPGARELRGHIEAVLSEGLEALGILCYARSVTEEPRKRHRYIDDVVLVLELARERDGLVGYVRGEAAAAAAKVGSVTMARTPMQNAIADLDGAPEGNAFPERIEAYASGYRRDNAVRAYVRRRANGRCEFCGAEGFVVSRRAQGANPVTARRYQWICGQKEPPDLRPQGTT